MRDNCASDDIKTNLNAQEHSAYAFVPAETELPAHTLFMRLGKAIQKSVGIVVISVPLMATPIPLPLEWDEDRRRRNATISYVLATDAETIQCKFDRLANRWRYETEYTGSIIQMAMGDAYQQIIGMGNDAVLLILKELEAEPDYWFWALKAITGANPIPFEDRGKLDKMTEAWLAWGTENGYC